MHDWDLTPKEAMALQRRLAERVIDRDDFDPIDSVAGVDVHLARGGKVARAAAAVLSYPDLELVDRSAVRLPIEFPYVPGLLSFREMPPALEALERLERPPDLILCDGHGYAHPRRFGLACHLGVWTGTPTIGVAKSRLTGRHDEVPEERGSWTPLYEEAPEDGGMEDSEILGAVLRTRARVKPVFVSVGHRVGLTTAIDIVLRSCTRYRLPEPARWAHRLAGRA